MNHKCLFCIGFGSEQGCPILAKFEAIMNRIQSFMVRKGGGMHDGIIDQIYFSE